MWKRRQAIGTYQTSLAIDTLILGREQRLYIYIGLSNEARSQG